MGLFEIRVAQPHHYPYESSRPQLGISPWFALRISHENVLIVVDVTPWLLLQYHHFSIHVSINKTHLINGKDSQENIPISEYPQLLSPFLVVSPGLIHVISLWNITMVRWHLGHTYLSLSEVGRPFGLLARGLFSPGSLLCLLVMALGKIWAAKVF